MNNHIKAAEYITNILENRFRVLGIRFGLDPILGIFPGIGDVITAGLSLYIVWIAIQLKAPGTLISQMIQNIIVDFIIGIVPVVGDLADFIFKSNTKNLALLKEFARIDIPEAQVIK